MDLQTQKVSAQEDSAVLWVFKLAMTISLDFFIRVESLPPGLILSLQIRHQPDRKMIFYEMIFYEIIFSAYQIPAWQRNNIFCNDILWNISSLQIKYQPGRETEHNKTGTCVTEQVEHRQKVIKITPYTPPPPFFWQSSYLWNWSQVTTYNTDKLKSNIVRAWSDIWFWQMPLAGGRVLKPKSRNLLQVVTYMRLATGGRGFFLLSGVVFFQKTTRKSMYFLSFTHFLHNLLCNSF